MAISVGGSLPKKASSCARRRFRRSTGWSAWSMPCSVKTDLDVSTPMRLYWVMDGSGLGLDPTTPILARDAVGPSTPTMTACTFLAATGGTQFLAVTGGTQF